MNKSKITILVAICVGLCVNNSFSFDLMGGAKNLIGGQSGSFNAQVEGIVKSLSDNRIKFLNAQELLGQALGMKTSQLEKIAEARSLLEGNTKAKNLKKSSKITLKVKNIQLEMVQEGNDLSDESKAQFGQGVFKFAEGLIGERAIVMQGKNLIGSGKSMAMSGNPLEKMTLIKNTKTLTSVVGLARDDIKEAAMTLKALMQFCKKQSISVPKSSAIDNALGE